VKIFASYRCPGSRTGARATQARFRMLNCPSLVSMRQRRAGAEENG
jgi:hypothetical protein